MLRIERAKRLKAQEKSPRIWNVEYWKWKWIYVGPAHRGIWNSKWAVSFLGREERESTQELNLIWLSFRVLGRYKCAFFQFQNLPNRSSPKPLLFSSYLLSKPYLLLLLPPPRHHLLPPSPSSHAPITWPSRNPRRPRRRLRSQPRILHLQRPAAAPNPSKNSPQGTLSCFSRLREHSSLRATLKGARSLTLSATRLVPSDTTAWHHCHRSGKWKLYAASFSMFESFVKYFLYALWFRRLREGELG